MVFIPSVGITGRVRVGPNFVLEGAMEWRISKTVTPIPINHFELPANADGVVFSAHMAGLAVATVTIRGLYNADPNELTEAGIPAIRIGRLCILDLFFVRPNFGYNNVRAICTQFEAGANIENQPNAYTATFQCVGDPGSAIFVT